MTLSYRRPSIIACTQLPLILTFGLISTPVAFGQLRIVTYNTNTFGTAGDVPGLPSSFRTIRPEADTVFEAIGEETVLGIQRPADIILLQEQQQVGSTTENLLQRLNAIYADQGITYARGVLNPSATGDPGGGSLGPGSFDGGEIRQGFVYRTDSVQLIEEDFFGNISGPTQPRSTQFIQFRPVGFGADADLFIFNSHFEAGDGLGFGDDLFARESEATDIRDFITDNGLGLSNVIVAGDLNVDSNFETSGAASFGGRSALQILSDGSDSDGRVLDPLFLPDPITGIVPNVDFQIFSPGVPNTQFGVDLGPFLTQSPSSGAGALVGGGIDDRFDFLLQSDELLDGEGLASISGTLRSFGNNGSTPNDQINDGNTIQISGLTSFSTAAVLNALEAASDHLPVVQDFQLPAVLEAALASVPQTVTQGELVEVELEISNGSDVQVPIGADELDFTFFTEGALLGSGAGVDAALGAGVVELITLDTSEIGLQTGLISVNTSSFAAANASLSIPVMFNVVAASLPGDFNQDSVVDAADFVALRDGLSAGDSLIDQFELFLENFGLGQPATGAAAVPEPASLLFAAVGAAISLSFAGRARPQQGRNNGIRA